MPDTPAYGWENCPDDVRITVNGFTGIVRSVLKGNLTGVYLHGSLAMGCFNPSSSDIDILVAAGNKLTERQKKEIIHFVLSDDLAARLIEMSVVIAAELETVTFPTPYELHYSQAWRNRYLAGKVDFTAHKYDEDLPAHFAVTRERGICLYGKPVREAFFPVPRPVLIYSLLRDVMEIFKNPAHNPVYRVLNLCRFLGFLSEGKLFSKKEGGEWALVNLPDRFQPLINAMLSRYTGNGTSQEPERSMISGFLRFAVDRINSLIDSKEETWT